MKDLIPFFGLLALSALLVWAMNNSLVLFIAVIVIAVTYAIVLEF